MLAYSFPMTIYRKLRNANLYVACGFLHALYFPSPPSIIHTNSPALLRSMLYLVWCCQRCSRNIFAAPCRTCVFTACLPIGMFGPQLVRREVDEPLAAAGVGPARRKGGGQAAESNRMGTEVEAPMGTSICEVPGPRGSSDCRAARASLFQEACGASEGAVWEQGEPEIRPGIQA